MYIVWIILTLLMTWFWARGMTMSHEQESRDKDAEIEKWKLEVVKLYDIMKEDRKLLVNTINELRAEADVKRIEK